MSKFKKLYRDFFGLREQQEKTNLPTDPEQLAAYNKELEKTKALMKSMTESDLDEAQLVNNLTDYLFWVYSGIGNSSRENRKYRFLCWR